MSNQIQNEPLVSVCIIAYNSEAYIVEALDSVAKQTYQNIELIISDDCSHDGTVEICRQWLSHNIQRFVRAEIITVEKNTGVSANCNRAIKKSQGKWIKYLAGDDRLLPNCITDNVEYTINNPSTDLLFSDMRTIGMDSTEREIISSRIFFEKLTKSEFKRRFFYQNFLPAPSNFMSRIIYDRVGGFDESIPFMEDKPFFLRILFKDGVISYMNKITVCYRRHPQSLSSPTIFNSKYLESCKLLNSWVLMNIRKDYPALWFFFRNWEAYQEKSSIRNSLLHFLRFINPAFYYHKYIEYKIRFYFHFSK